MNYAKISFLSPIIWNNLFESLREPSIEGIEKIEKLLKRKGIGCVSYTGKMSEQQRITAINEFRKESNIYVFLGTFKAVGIGLTLTEASYVIHSGNTDTESIFGWEIAHRNALRRKRRKLEQLIIDEITFVFSGIAGLVAFWLLVSQPHWAIQVLCWSELVLLVILGVEIIIYADLAKGR